MRRPTQNQFSHSAERSLKSYELFPSSTISTSIKLYSSIYSPKKPSKDITRIGTTSKDKIFASNNIELSSSNPNRMVFHHYQKCNTFQFTFGSIFDQYTKPPKISSSINLYHSLFQQNKDVCVIAMGAEQSGIEQLCEGSQTAHKKQGLFYQLMLTLWNKLQSIKNQETSMGINSIRVTLKMLAIQDQKLYDMLSPKTQVTLKDNSHKVVIGCSSFEVMSVYDLHIKLMQVFHQKKLIYSSDSIAVIQAEITISKETYLITDQSVNVRYFTFIQWQRGNTSPNNSTPSKTKPHNSQSLLTLNMCIYQLYKISCHQPQNITQAQVKQLWANFRTTHITMILKYFFMRGNKISYIGCVSLKEGMESENFQILMVAKNLGKIDLAKFIQYAQANGINNKLMENSDVRAKKMKTEPIQSSPQQPSPSIKLRKLKQNLQRILKEKQSTQQKQKQQEIVTLFKQQKQRRRQLQNIRYKKQEIKIRQDYNKLHQISSHNNSRIIQKDNTQPITLPHLPQRKLSKLLQPSQEQLSRLAKEQQSAMKRIASIHTQIMQTVQQQSNSRLGRNILQMQVKLHEKEMLEFVNNKNKILSLLKNQIKQLKAEEIESRPSERPKGVSHAQRKIKIKSRMDDHSHTKTIQHKPSKSQLNPETQILVNQQQPFPSSQSPLLQQQPQQKNEKIFKLQALKKMNKNNYFFQKRRMLLKAKLSKGRQQLNQFYDQAAKKFQQYKSK